MTTFRKPYYQDIIPYKKYKIQTSKVKGRTGNEFSFELLGTFFKSKINPNVAILKIGDEFFYSDISAMRAFAYSKKRASLSIYRRIGPRRVKKDGIKT